jgi:2-oxoisovalerate dehydrogenase E1 component
MPDHSSILEIADQPFAKCTSDSARPNLRDDVQLLELMARSRESERREGLYFRQGKGRFHIPGAGHEVFAVIAQCLDRRDLIYPHYRDRALMLARGTSTYELALSYFARADAHDGGRQLASHFSDATRNVMSCASPTGLQCLPAAGSAWAAKFAGAGYVTLCCLGDATSRQGEFYEALCFALQERLAIVFVVEDNGYGISTPTARLNPYAIAALSPDHLVRVDARDIEALRACGEAAVTKARSGGGPTVIWAAVDRLLSHTSSDDHRRYRSAAEIAAMTERDPIPLLRDRLIAAGALNEEDWGRRLLAIQDEVDRDYRVAFDRPKPECASAKQHVFADATLVRAWSDLPKQTFWTMVEALNHTLEQMLRTDSRVLLFGQDIEDPKGGVFGVTKGLSNKFPERVHNSPLAEATIAGIGAGLAIAGRKPIVELQFIDFVGPAFNQIANQIATLRWRSIGNWSCPMVIMAPCGAYLPCGGPWHSQTNEGWFAHIPGLQVVVPSTPVDAAALLRAAVEGHDPVLLLLPKHLFRERFTFLGNSEAGLGEASIRTSGTDATIVAWGNCVLLALDAAATLHDEEGWSMDVIDLRSLVPCDWDAIRRSVRKTGRLVVVQEDNRTCSFGQSIVSEVASEAETWRYLVAGPQLVTRDDVHVGFSPALEAAVLPSVQDICAAVRRTMEK